jgi:cytochrome c-type biogenesis protein CcmF
MLAEVATLALGLAVVLAVYGALAAYLGVRRDSEPWATSARYAAHAVAALLALDVLLLAAALLANLFEIAYVYQHSNRGLPLWLKASAVWAGQEGSLLVWAAMQGLVAALFAGSGRMRGALQQWALAILHLITLFFAGMTLLLSNPFAQTSLMPMDGTGLNPLLRHPGMVFHPPPLLAGYVALSVPFALALAALISGKVDDWIERARPWILAGWLALGLGLLLGARWAYDVLGWGGYWGWDPVENAGLMPWLTATALLHGGIMQARRAGFRVWNVVLAALSFWLVVFGTFATRSGVIQSVHAYARSNVGTPFLALMLVVTMATTVGLVARRRLLLSEDGGDHHAWQQGAFFVTLALLMALTVSIWIGSVLPTLTELAGLGRMEAGSEWFDRVTGPQFAALLLVMGLCPLAGSTVRALARLRQRMPAILLGATLAVAAFWLSGVRDPWVLVALAVVAWSCVAILAEVCAGARPMGNGMVARWGSLLAGISRRRRAYGAHLVHLGVVLMAVGIIGTRMDSLERQMVLSPGHPQDVGEVTLVYEDLAWDNTPADHALYRAAVTVYRQGQYVVTLNPELHYYDAHGQTVAVPALRSTAREDLYLILAGWDATADNVTFKVHVNRLVNWLWLGGLVLLAGGALAAWPAASMAARTRGYERRIRVWNGAGLAAGSLLLLGAMVSMWGIGHGRVVRDTHRPVVGSPAPDVAVELLDGSSWSPAQARGDVVVLSFWASWCPTCGDTAPLLEAIWDDYGGRGMTMLGIAVADDLAEVSAAAGRYGLSYPLAMDHRDGRAARAYGVTSLPAVVVIDADGHVVYHREGPTGIARLRGELDRLVAGGGD